MNDIRKQYDEWKQRSLQLRKMSFDFYAHETDDQRNSRISDLLLPQNYDQFFEYYFGGEAGIAKSPCADFHVAQAKELYNCNIIQQFRLMFRGAAKSVHANIGNPLQLIMSHKVKFFVLIGLNEDRAKLLLADLQLQLESNNRIIADFGNQRINGSWTDGEFQTANGVYCLALGINQPFRGLRNLGNRVDYAVVDDCEDRKRAENQKLTIECADRITSDLMGAFDKDHRRLVVANNYFVRNGLIDKLLERLKDKPDTRVHQINITDKFGKPTWHQRYSVRDIENIRNSTDPLSFSREYMNTPVDEGKLFKPEWLAPIPSAFCLLHSAYQGYLIHWDLSYKTDGDFKAAAIVAHTGNQIHIVDVFCRQCSVPEAMDWHFQTMRRYSHVAMFAFYDATASQREIFEPQWHDAAARNQSPYIPMPNIARAVDKHIRIEATLISAFFNQRLKVTEAATKSTDWQQAKSQMLGFEKGTKAHDDFPDTLENAVHLADKMFLQTTQNLNFNPYIGHDRNPNDKFY